MSALSIYIFAISFGPPEDNFAPKLTSLHTHYVYMLIHVMTFGISLAMLLLVVILHILQSVTQNNSCSSWFTDLAKSAGSVHKDERLSKFCWSHVIKQVFKISSRRC